ncbi:hypothetical protein [Peptostreptococcus faecalis]|uniref:hypothetical protein n=1 Tax=Peptostreptococcus faecalis TaxID=2045015 RepID=UPI000C7CD0F4|nr:hypothetical protein [Peptostreptococcus faecalis]
MNINRIRKNQYMDMILIFFIFMVFNWLLEMRGIKWAEYPYQYVIPLSFSVVVSFSRRLVRFQTREQCNKMKLFYILAGAISMITIISYIRDIMSGTAKVIKSGVLSVETCQFIICLIFMILFLSYLYVEFRSRKINS